MTAISKMASPDYVELSDEIVGRYFSHLLPEFAVRQPGSVWRFPKVRVRLNEVRCYYATPGGGEHPGGFMAGVGLTVNCEGANIAEVAGAIERRLARVDIKNKSIQQVITFYQRGEHFILSREEPIALVRRGEVWYVREGTHRAVALAWLKVPHLDSFDIEHGERVGP